jgi:prophage maintenance system killer protein
MVNGMKKEVIIYQAKNGAIELRGDFSRETIWATQAQMAEVFGVNSQAVTKHLKNIYKEGELSKKATCSKMEQVQKEGKRSIRRSVELYNLDAIISVGYRINSKMGTSFRKWDTTVLREHITDGFTINRKRIGANYGQFLKAVDEIKHFLPEGVAVDTGDVVELVQMFATTWLSLDAYDRSDFPASGATRRQVLFTAEELAAALMDLKRALMEKKEASDLFGAERARDSVVGIVGNVFQSFGGKDVYPTVEEKAAHLLYFVVKNHPFTDGNKRSGAFAFIWFLRSAKLLDPTRLTPEALTALTLLVAESKASEKDRVVGLVLLLLRR